MTPKARKLKEVRNSLELLDGISIPYNLIKHSITPLREWLDAELEKENKKRYY